MAQTSRSQTSSQMSPKAGAKRAGDTSSPPAAKRDKKGQMTLEETMPAIGGKDGAEDEMEGIEDSKEIAKQIEGGGSSDGETESKEDGLKAREEAVKKREDAVSVKERSNGENEDGTATEKSKSGTATESEETTSKNGTQKGEKNAFEEVKSDTKEVHAAAKEEQDTKTAQITSNNDSVIPDAKREATIPSSIMEKGIIYFFFRSRVNTENPQGIEDIARSYIVLRPLPLGAKIGDGPLQDDGKARLMALPKKMLPKSRTDRFLMFVERAGASIADLRAQFAGSEYATKTAGYVFFLISFE
jgi:hypothetical protein